MSTHVGGMSVVIGSLLCLLVFFSPLHSPFPVKEVLNARVIGVSDGDTIDVLVGRRTLTIRVEGVDCPENGAAFSTKAKAFTSSLVFNRPVVVKVKELDTWGRTVARVYVGGTDLSAELIRVGLGWHYKQYSDDPVLARAEELARAGRVGVWSLPDPVPPWEDRWTRTAQRRLSKPAPEPGPSGAGLAYHGNSSSKVFHSPKCASYSCKNCTVIFHSVEAAIAAGFRPCRICNPGPE